MSKLKGMYQVSSPEVRSLSGVWGKSGWISGVPVVGNSMKPSLYSGDIIKVSHRIPCVRPGDIAVFYRADRLVVHRVIKVKKSGAFLTKGDNLLFFDRPCVTEDEMIGIVISINRKGRGIDIRTGSGRLVAACIAGISLLMGNYPRFFGCLLQISAKEKR